MVNPALVDKIKKELANGHSEEQIYNYLVEEGYKPHDAVEAINYYNKTSVSPKNRPKPGSLMPVLIVGIILIVVVGGGIYYVADDNIAQVFTKSHLESPGDLSEINNKTPSSESKRAAPAQTLAVECRTMKCFNDKFMECMPASLTYTSQDGTTVYYEIISSTKQGSCEVLIRNIADPNPELVQKQMNCNFDNSIDFLDALQNITGCSGLLYDLIIKDTSSQGEKEDCNRTCSTCVSNAMKILRSSSKKDCVECTADSDCIEGFECFSDNTCINRTIIRDSPKCNNLDCSAYNCSSCNTGFRRCQTSTVEWKNNRCIECSSDNDCLIGYSCEEYKCTLSI